MVQTENRVNLTTLATTETTGAATGTASYVDVIGNTKNVYEYNVYAINTVGDTWDYSNPALNNLAPGAGFPTITVDSQGGTQQMATLTAPTDANATATIANKKTATVTVTWKDTSSTETGFLVQRSTTANFSLNVVNATVGPNVTTLNQSVPRAQTFYYRVLAFDNAKQSAWSNTATVTTP